MTRKGCFLIVLFALASFGCASSGDRTSETLTAVDVTGTWEGTIGYQNGVTRSLRLVLRQEGAKVTADMDASGPIGSQKIDGLVKGKDFNFYGTRVRADATVSGDEMSGSVDWSYCPCKMVLRRIEK